MIKYLGSKRQLLGQILRSIKQAHPEAKSVVDLFSGTARVGHALKKEGYQVFSNDHNSYAYSLAQCYVESDREEFESDATKLINELNGTRPNAGYFTESFAHKSRFFHPKNAEKIDAIRDAIEAKGLEPLLKSVLLVSLMEAADRVDSTCGIQMAYLKQWAKRAHNDISLRMPDVLPRAKHGKGKAFCLEADQAAAKLQADVAYLDPPYNQHSYRGNYHIWETLVLWDKPELYGIAHKRIDCKEKKSSFNSKTQFISAFSKVLDALKCDVVVISFNNEGFVTRKEMEALLSARGQVSTKSIDYKRYVGAQIGIHNPRGEKVGEVSHLRNREYLYVLSRRA
jgi:adenine-specific DNA-methyltransferase